MIDGSLIGEDFTLAIAAAWAVSALALGGLAAYALNARRALRATEKGAGDE